MALEHQQSNTLQNSHSFPQSVVAPMLPTEMVVDILLRLPVKSLLRCKSVCKLWCSLISDPSFVKSHLTLSNSADRYAHRRVFCKMENIFKTCPVHVIFDDPISDLEVDYPFEHSHGDFSVVGSCNGLICMFNGNHTMVVWNPSTRKSHYLPTHEKKLGDRVYGFGFDKSTDDYKAVTVYYGPKNRIWDWHVTSVMIYSLKTGKWKEIDAVPNGYIPLFQSNTCLNGAVHWIANKGVGPSSHSRIIISLDLAKETYGEVLQPAYDDGYDMLTVGALREWLCVACSYDVVFRMDIWVMKVYGVENSWTKLVSISCPPDPTWFFLPVRFTISHEGKFLLRHGSKLIVYDSKNGSSSEYSFEGKFQAWIYVESLVSPVPLAGLEDIYVESLVSPVPLAGLEDRF